MSDEQSVDAPDVRAGAGACQPAAASRETVSGNTPPARTWLPMALWTAAILAALGMAWYVALMYSRAQERWIARTMVRLAEIRRNGVNQFAEAEDNLEERGYLFRIRNGAIRVGTNGWVYIITHSMHDDYASPMSPLLPAVGDVALAIDQDGNYFVCYAHVCGGALLMAEQTEGFKDIEDFVNSPRYRTGKWKWKPLR